MSETLRKKVNSPGPLFYHLKDSSSIPSNVLDLEWSLSNKHINDNFIQQLPTMFTCGDGKDDELSNQALAAWI